MAVVLGPGCDLRFVVAQAAKESNAVGFLPRRKYAELDRLGRLAVVYDLTEPLGFAGWGSGRDGVLRVYQIAVRFDVRRVRWADQLVQVLEWWGRVRGCRAVQLRCADDLEANAFWQFEGYVRYGQSRPDNRRRRLINHYWRWLRDQVSVRSWEQLCERPACVMSVRPSVVRSE